MATKKKILFCVTSLDPQTGGIARVSLNLARIFAENRKNYEVTILSLHGNAQIPEEMANPEAVNYLKSRLHLCHSSKWAFVKNFLWLFLNTKPELVLIDHVQIAVVAALFRLVLPVRYALICHGIELERAFSRLRKYTLFRAELRICNSHYTADRLQGRFPQINFVPCPLGINKPPRGKLTTRTTMAFPDAIGKTRRLSERSILIVGRTESGERYKGHDILIKGLHEIVPVLPRAQLLIVGTGNDLGRLRNLAIQYGVEKNVLFAGYVSPEELIRAYRKCYLYAMPSRHEGFGLVYAEAMSYGKPCLASNVDAGAELVVDGVTGYCVNPDTEYELVERLTRLLKSPTLANKMGRAGAQRFLKLYTLESFSERFFSLITSPDELAPTRAQRPLKKAA